MDWVFVFQFVLKQASFKFIMNFLFEGVIWRKISHFCLWIKSVSTNIAIAIRFDIEFNLSIQKYLIRVCVFHVCLFYQRLFELYFSILLLFEWSAINLKLKTSREKRGENRSNFQEFRHMKLKHVDCLILQKLSFDWIFKALNCMPTFFDQQKSDQNRHE